MMLRIWLAVAMLGTTAVMWAAAPPVPWTEAQLAKLAERDRLKKALPGLLFWGQNGKAAATAERILTIELELGTPTDPEAIAALERLSRWHEVLGQFPQAVKVRQALLAVQEKRFGKGHWEVTDARLALEDMKKQGQIKEEQSDQLLEAMIRHIQVMQLSQRGKTKEALALAVKVRDVRAEILGKKHPDYASSLNNLAGLYQDMGENAKALLLFKEALAIREEILGKTHPSYVTSLNNLAGLYRDLGENDNALPLFKESLGIAEEVLGKKHPLYLTSLNNLAMIYRDIGENAKALSLLKESQVIAEEVLGKKHPNYAGSLNNLAALHHAMGEYAKALPLYKDALVLIKEVLGKKHPSYVTNLNNLAMLYQDMGENDKALSLLKETLAIAEEVQGKKHPLYITSLNNLAALYHATGEYAKALPLYKDALVIIEEILGKKHTHNANILNNLAGLYNEMGENAKALPLFKEALAITEEALGKKHPDYAQSLNNLAWLYMELGENAKALPLLNEALAIRKEVLGKKHPDYANSLNSLALLYQATGTPNNAAKASSDAMEVLQRHLDNSFDRLGERQRNHTFQQVLCNLGALLSFQEQAELPTSERYTPVLTWKGRVAAFSVLDRLAADHPELKETVDKLQSTRARLARLTLQTPTPAQQAGWLKQIQTLTEEKEVREADLARRSADFRVQKQLKSLTPEQLTKQLSSDVAFVDLIEYDYYFGPKDGKGKEKGESRLLAFVSRAGKEVVAVSLGKSKPITDAVTHWRVEIEKEPKADRKVINKSATILREKVWDKLAKHTGDAKTIIVAPDGALTQFPLAALPGSKERTYLIEEVAIVQVASAAQLFALLEPPASDAKVGKGLLAVGGIDYGKGNGTESAPYTALPGTAPEARRCRDLFLKSSDENAALLEGSDATPTALRQEMAKRPRHLHLATHGYFEPPERVERLLKGLVARREDRTHLWQQQVQTFRNLPGLRCGLALSGANAQPPADDPDALPNVLTGQDLEGIDLRGCEVAVLSACQTGQGDIERSQGVVGLQRALHIAGVRTTVTSLWSVQDAATAELMEEFYKRLWGKEKISRIEALRQAQLAILRDPERVRKRSAALLAEAEKRRLPEATLRGIKGRLASDLPDKGKVEEAKKPKTSPEAWWAAFVLSGDWR